MQLNKLIEFRQQVYEALGRAQDAQMELLDAVVSGGRINSFVELSLSPLHRRQWHSAYAALTRSGLDVRRLRQIMIDHLPADTERVFSLDGTLWTHRRARTLSGLVLEPLSDKSRVVPAHLYSALCWIPQPHQSWALPISTERVPWVGSEAQTGVAQVVALCQQDRSDSLNVITADGRYGTTPFLAAVKDLDCTCVVRLRCDRVLYRAPPPYSGFGRPRVHGSAFRFADPMTWGDPDETVRFQHERYGQIRLQRWRNLHAKDDAATVFDVLLATVHLGERHSAQRWLAVTHFPAGYSVQHVWQWYDYRYSIEPAFRFRKHDLFWTLPRFQDSLLCDRWTVLVDCAIWLLYLAQPVLADHPLPWQRPQQHLTPGRAKRAMLPLLATLPPLALPPQPRGKSLGWPKGRLRSKPERFLVIKRRRKRAKLA